MATKTWTGSGDWHTALNWSPSGVPDATSDVVFNSTSVANCNVSSDCTAASIDIQSSYSGQFAVSISFFGDPYTATIGGNVTFAGSGNVALGNSRWNIGGSFDNHSQVTWTPYQTVISLTGSSDATIAGTAKSLSYLVINKATSTARVTLGGNVTAQTFTGTSGRFDLHGYTLTSAGNVTVETSTGFQFHNGTDNDMLSGVIDINSGAISLSGTLPTKLEIDDLDFDLASGVTSSVKYANVSSSTCVYVTSPMDATAATNTDNGSNVGWDFGITTVNVDCTAGAIDVEALVATVQADVDTSIVATVASAEVAALSATVQPDVDTQVACTLATVNATTYSCTVIEGQNVECNAVAVQVATNAASINAQTTFTASATAGISTAAYDAIVGNNPLMPMNAGYAAAQVASHVATIYAAIAIDATRCRVTVAARTAYVPQQSSGEKVYKDSYITQSQSLASAITQEVNLESEIH